MKYKPKPHQQASWSMKANYQEVNSQISRWEKFLIAENIADEDLKKNPKVLAFVKEHAGRFYVPTKVLKMYGVSVEG